ncbi:MAG: hypothetical protein GXX94_00215 [Chloroflexi bacterium]|nr:hypothetical protein [Chloroflexota bacterium]
MTDTASSAPGGLPYREQLEGHLQSLLGEALPEALERIDLAALNFLVSGMGLGRCILDIEQVSQDLAGLLPLTDPESVEDAIVVRESTVRAMEYIGQILALLRDWIRSPEMTPSHTNSIIRELFHGLNNIFVGINCYAELLLMELREGDSAYFELRTVLETGGEAARLVRDRATLQRLLNETEEATPSQRSQRERDVLAMLIDGLCANESDPLVGPRRYRQEELEVYAGKLPPVEARVLREAARRMAL